MLDLIRGLVAPKRRGFSGAAGELTAADWRDERAYWRDIYFALLKDRWGLGPHPLQSDNALVPSPELATRIQNTSKARPDTFFGSAYRQTLLYLDELKLLGVDPTTAGAILELGVGFGRLLVQWLPFGSQLYGCDVTPEVVDFAQARLGGLMDLRVTSTEPPLPYKTGQFGFVYANSVFTHIPLKAQEAWAREVARVTRPGGVVIVSYLEANSYFSGMTYREFYDNWETPGGAEANSDRGVQLLAYMSDAVVSELWGRVGKVVAIRHHFRDQKHVLVRIGGVGE